MHLSCRKSSDPTPVPFAASGQMVYLLLLKADLSTCIFNIIFRPHLWDNLTLLLFYFVRLYWILFHIKKGDVRVKKNGKESYIGSTYQLVLIFSVKYMFQERNNLNPLPLHLYLHFRLQHLGTTSVSS